MDQQTFLELINKSIKDSARQARLLLGRPSSRATLQEALHSLSPEDSELLFLHYVNDVPVSVISSMYKISRFAAYRKLKAILKKIRRELEGTKNE